MHRGQISESTKQLDIPRTVAQQGIAARVVSSDQLEIRSIFGTVVKGSCRDFPKANQNSIGDDGPLECYFSESFQMEPSHALKTAPMRSNLKFGVARHMGSCIGDAEWKANDIPGSQQSCHHGSAFAVAMHNGLSNTMPDSCGADYCNATESQYRGWTPMSKSCPHKIRAPISPEVLLVRSLAPLLLSPLVRRSVQVLPNDVILGNTYNYGDCPLFQSARESDGLPAFLESDTSWGRPSAQRAAIGNSQMPNSLSQRPPSTTSPSEASSKSDRTLVMLSPDSLKPENSVVIDMNGIGVSLSIPIRRDGENRSNIFTRLIPWFLLSVCGVSRPATAIEVRDIVGDITGTFLPGRLVALLGPSGAGKSTLLNVLAGRVRHTSGQLKFNGNVITSPNEAKRYSAYVQQLDTFLPNLSVEEHLESQIHLRLKGLHRSQRRALLESVLARFRLIKCRKTLIGNANSGISGGERKRLSVASEVLTNPEVLLADEPTTGIDSFMAHSVVAILRKLAGSGRSVIASLHQPSSQLFALFDEVMLMAEGRVLYFGDRLGSIEWFRRLGFECPKLTNTADFLVKLVSPENPETKAAKMLQITEWAELWKQKGDAFLQSWTDNERFTFFENSKTFAEKNIEIALRQRSISPIQSSPESPSPFSSLRRHPLNRSRRRNKVELPHSTLRRRSNDAVWRSFTYSSPRIAQRELPSTRVLKQRSRKNLFHTKMGCNSPGSRIIDKHQKQKGYPLNSHPLSPPTFGLGSTVQELSTQTTEEQKMELPALKSLISKSPLSPGPRSSWIQFWVLLKRALASNSRDRILVHARALQTVFIALTYGSVFFRLGNSVEDSKSKLSAIFFVLTNQGLVGAVGVCSTFVCEKVVIRREVEGGIIRITPYIVAKIIADLPVQTFFPIIFNAICFWMMGLHYEWKRFALSCLVALMVCNAAISVGYLGSATAPNSDQALITAQIWAIPALLFGGYAVKLDDIPAPLSPLQYLSYFRYGYIAYSYLVFNGAQIDMHHPQGIMYSGESFVKSYVGFSLTGIRDFWVQIFWLFLLIVVFRMLIILLVIPSSKRWRENQ